MFVIFELCKSSSWNWPYYHMVVVETHQGNEQSSALLAEIYFGLSLFPYRTRRCFGHFLAFPRTLNGQGRCNGRDDILPAADISTTPNIKSNSAWKPWTGKIPRYTKPGAQSGAFVQKGDRKCIKDAFIASASVLFLFWPAHIETIQNCNRRSSVRGQWTPS